MYVNAMIYVYICKCMYITYTYIYTMYAHTNAHIDTHEHIHTRTHTFTRTHAYAHEHAHTYPPSWTPARTNKSDWFAAELRLEVSDWDMPFVCSCICFIVHAISQLMSNCKRSSNCLIQFKKKCVMLIFFRIAMCLCICPCRTRHKTWCVGVCAWWTSPSLVDASLTSCLMSCLPWRAVPYLIFLLLVRLPYASPS